MALPNPIQGAIGGWWFLSPSQSLNETTFLMNVGLSKENPIAEFDIELISTTSTGSITTAVDYDLVLRYAGAGGGTKVTIRVNKPIPDSAIGKVVGGQPRSSWCVAWRFVATFQCSTWTGSDFLSDGFVNLYLNGATVPILSATGKRIPIKFATDSNLRYSFSPYIDCDRIWARSTAVILPTNPDGSMIGAAPADLIFFDDFNGGLHPDWTHFTFFPGFDTPAYAWPNSGGGGGYGLSVYCCPPDASACAGGLVNASFAGLTRLALSEIPPLPPGDGIYYLNPNKVAWHDSYYNAVEKKIPSPLIHTAVLGD